jgi:REP element-mobilizing transposase RayT
MASSFIYSRYHLIWSSKHRENRINDSWRDRLYAYMGSVLNNKGGALLRAGGRPDHVHLYASLPPTLSLAQAVNALKSNSSRWARQSIDGCSDFAWQDGYSAFSVSPSTERRLLNYIDNQDEHHRKRSFREELIALLRRHGIEYDERYLEG